MQVTIFLYFIKTNHCTVTSFNGEENKSVLKSTQSVPGNLLIFPDSLN